MENPPQLTKRRGGRQMTLDTTSRIGIQTTLMQNCKHVAKKQQVEKKDIEMEETMKEQNQQRTEENENENSDEESQAMVEHDNQRIPEIITRCDLKMKVSASEQEDVTLQQTLQSIFERIKMSDTTAIILPWKENGEHPPIRNPNLIPWNWNQIKEYSPNAYPRPEGDSYLVVFG